MGKAVKARERLFALPKDFSWDELTAVMGHFGYDLKTSGGSSRKFIHPLTKATFMIHEPHPAHILKMYQVREVVNFLRQEKHHE